jgi:hypothetical protein
VRTAPTRSRWTKQKRIQVCRLIMSASVTHSPSDADDTDCEVCHSLSPHGMLLCDLCDRGFHMACLTPPLAKEPDEEWYCPLCSQLRSTDVHYKTVARVRMFWKKYDEWFIGYVVGVRAATDDDVQKAKGGRVVRGGPIYQVYYDQDDVQWQALKQADFLRADEEATELAKATDKRLGHRICVWHSGGDSVGAGWYNGVVSDVRVERLQRFADKMLYLVRYDAGDAHWHDLTLVRWQFENDSKQLAKRAFGVNAGGRVAAIVHKPQAELEAEAAAAVVAKRMREELAQSKAEAARTAQAGAVEAAAHEKWKREVLETTAADWEGLRRRLEASRGKVLAARLHALIRHPVTRAELGKGGAGRELAKLVGRLERLKHPEAIAMAADATAAVQAAAKRLVAAWTAQIEADEAAAAATTTEASMADMPKPAKAPRCSAETREESDDEVYEIGEVTRAERDARGRAEAVVIDE